MATNERYAAGVPLSLTCTAPTTPAAGDPVLIGQIPGVALTDERSDGTTSVALGGVFALAVGGVDDDGNSAVAVGDVLYYDAAATPKINKDAVNGVRFGYALGTVASGGSGTINVLVGY